MWSRKVNQKLLINFDSEIYSQTKVFSHPGHARDFAWYRGAANACPLRAWLKCRTITTHARQSVADLSRNCKGFRARESVHARVTESRAQGTGVCRDIRQSPSRVRSVFLLIYGFSVLPHLQLLHVSFTDQPIITGFLLNVVLTIPHGHKSQIGHINMGEL